MRKLDVLIYGTNLEAKPFRIPGGALVEVAADFGDILIASATMTGIASGWIRMLTRNVEVEIFPDEYDGALVVKVQPRDAGRPVAGKVRPDENATAITPPDVRWVASGPEGVN